MDIGAVLGYQPAAALDTPAAATERPAYLEADGTTSDGTSTATRGRGDTAMSAGALALLAIAGLIGLRMAFRGALP